ncbi:MAG TPA: amidase [Acidimicrobiales bacterium]|nr:amidase [Acidimicrobiales bacterium]
MTVTDAPWPGDTCSLVDAFRSGERSPAEELEATLAAIDASELNAWSFRDDEVARRTAAEADVSLPFGGVPMGIKELDHVAGWPFTNASVPLADQVSAYDATKVSRLRDAGAVLVGMTTASEFGGVNLTRTVLNGITRNPWQPDRTPGGSSGGTASAVAGGHVTIGTAGDGGGSIRIPAGFTGMVGLKVTYGRIPKGPHSEIGSLTAVPGCISRSVRDSARWLDVSNGHDRRDPLSLPRVEGWEAGLGSHLGDLRGARVAVLPTFADATVAPDVVGIVDELGGWLTDHLGLTRVDVDVRIPSMGTAWALAGLLAEFAALGDRWPDCEDQLTPQIRHGLRFAHDRYGIDARILLEQRRTELFEAMAGLFDDVDLVVTPTNPDVAFAAEGPLPDTFGGIKSEPGNNGRLTIPGNIYGNPGISIPAGTVGGLPVGVQVMAPHHQEAVLLDVALAVERERPWPLVAPGSPS